MPDRVKEAVFSLLGSRFATPGRLPPIRIADMFAGGGTMGLEALSRGAASCVFFEQDRDAVVVLRRNLREIGVGDEASIVVGDAWKSAITSDDGLAFDLVILDPPYSDSEDTTPTGRVWRFLTALVNSDRDRPLVLLHHQAALPFEEQSESPWCIVDRRTFGTSGITVFS